MRGSEDLLGSMFPPARTWGFGRGRVPWPTTSQAGNIRRRVSMGFGSATSINPRPGSGFSSDVKERKSSPGKDRDPDAMSCALMIPETWALQKPGPHATLPQSGQPGRQGNGRWRERGQTPRLLFAFPHPRHLKKCPLGLGQATASAATGKAQDKFRLATFCHSIC